MSLKKTLNRIRSNLLRPLLRLKGRIILVLKNAPPDIIIMVDGGFCSVLNKYVLGLCFEQTTNLQVKYDLSWFNGNGLDCDGKHSRPFQLLDIFPDLDYSIATPEEVRFYKRHFYVRNTKPYTFLPSFLTRPRPMYVDGYFEHWKYFDLVKRNIRNNLSFNHIQLDSQSLAIKSAIQSEKNSVAVHVRRGDFINLGLCILTPEYYLAAIDECIKRFGNEPPHFFFFSNDMVWVRKNILKRLPENIFYTPVDINNNEAGYKDLFLIAECKHQISSNSSFGYWGGLLNTYKKKLVIVPNQWLPESSHNNIKLADSQEAHRVPGWLTFPVNG
jgi:hypothetical protein